MVDEKFDVDILPALLNRDDDRTARARERQTAVWEGRRPDAWPIFLSAPLREGQKSIPNPDFRDAFYDADLMTCSQVRAACTVYNARSDAVPSIRANLGTGVCLSCLGLQQEVFADKMPWLKRHLTRQEVAALEPDDIAISGDFERGLGYMRRFLKVLDGAVPVYCMDTQGPLDLAHLILGDDMFLAFYDDPAFTHHLMEIALAVGIKCHEWMKEVSGEPKTELHHGNGIYAENMGIRVCEDTTAIIGEELMETFAMPYTRRLADHFGGAWLHYCGRADYLTHAALRAPEIRAVNFGHIPGHEELHDFEQSMQWVKDAEKVYFGPWPRTSGESGKAYLSRLHEWAAEGVLIPVANAAVGSSEDPTAEDGAELFPGCEEALEYWYSLG